MRRVILTLIVCFASFCSTSVCYAGYTDYLDSYYDNFTTYTNYGILDGQQGWTVSTHTPFIVTCTSDGGYIWNNGQTAIVEKTYGNIKGAGDYLQFAFAAGFGTFEPYPGYVTLEYTWQGGSDDYTAGFKMQNNVADNTRTFYYLSNTGYQEIGTYPGPGSTHLVFEFNTGGTYNIMTDNWNVNGNWVNNITAATGTTPGYFKVESSLVWDVGALYTIGSIYTNPEPATMMMFLSGLVGMGYKLKRRFKKVKV
jgi:hypothetical protein